MVNTYQPINSTALEALALMRDQAEYRQVTISSTAVGNALGVKQETARRNMRSLVDMNLLEVGRRRTPRRPQRRQEAHRDTPGQE